MWAARNAGRDQTWTRRARDWDNAAVAAGLSTMLVLCGVAVWKNSGAWILVGPIGPLLVAFLLQAVYRVTIGGTCELTIGEDSLRWGWSKPKQNLQRVPFSDIAEVQFYYDDTWLMWIVESSGRKSSVGSLFTLEQARRIARTLRERGVPVREIRTSAPQLDS
jgi:hypothetical protein